MTLKSVRVLRITDRVCTFCKQLKQVAVTRDTGRRLIVYREPTDLTRKWRLKNEICGDCVFLRTWRTADPVTLTCTACRETKQAMVTVQRSNNVRVLREPDCPSRRWRGRVCGHCVYQQGLARRTASTATAAERVAKAKAARKAYDARRRLAAQMAKAATLLEANGFKVTPP
jgi:hypothetical protein